MWVTERGGRVKPAEINARFVAYRDALGFQEQAQLPSAAFVAAGGYHHHLGINLLEGRDAAPVEPDVAGLESFEVGRLEASVKDPDGIEVILPQA